MLPLSMFVCRTGNNVLKKSTQLISSISVQSNQRFISTTKMVQIKVSSFLSSSLILFRFRFSKMWQRKIIFWSCFCIGIFDKAMVFALYVLLHEFDFFFSWIVIFVQYLYAKSFRRTIRMQMTLKRWQKRYVMNKNNICSFFPRFFVYISYRFYLYTLIMTINLTFTGRWQTTKRWFIRRFTGEQSQHCRLERQQKNRIVCRSRCIYTRLFKGTNFEFFIEKLSIFRNSWKIFFRFLFRLICQVMLKKLTKSKLAESMKSFASQ